MKALLSPTQALSPRLLSPMSRAVWELDKGRGPAALSCLPPQNALPPMQFPASFLNGLGWEEAASEHSKSC